MAEEERIVEDPSISAYCALPRIKEKYHTEVIPFVKSDGKVAFIVRGDYERALANLYQDQPVLEFMKSLRAIRSAIFAFKQMKNGGKSER